MKGKYKISANRTVFTYNYLRNISHLTFGKAKKEKKGPFNNCLLSMLFSAFCVEAYLNHLGSEKTDFWEAVERCSPKEKLIIISRTIKYKIDWGHRPFQTFESIFSFRNKLVHAKTHNLSALEEQILEDEEDPSMPLSNWEKLVNLKMAERFLKDTKEIIGILHSKAGLKEPALGILETSTFCK